MTNDFFLILPNPVDGANQCIIFLDGTNSQVIKNNSYQGENHANFEAYLCTAILQLSKEVKHAQ